MLMNTFGPKVEFSDENEKHRFSKICEMLRIYKDHGKKKEQRKTNESRICNPTILWESSVHVGDQRTKLEMAKSGPEKRS